MNRIKIFLIKNKTLFLLLAIIVLAAVSSKRFASVSNVTNIAQQIAPNGIIAIGLTLVVITGGFDMSVGSIMSLTGVVIMLTMKNGGALPLALSVGLLIGVIAGLINGLLVGIAGITPFITTLGTMTLIRGIALGITEAHPVTFWDESFSQFAMGKIGFMPCSFLAFIVFALFFGAFLRYTRIGHNIFIYGSNREAGYIAGINMTGTLILTYVLCGLMASAAGIFLASKIGAGSPVIGEDACLLGMTAIIIGGNKLMNGRANLLMTVIGVLILGVLNNMMNLLRTMAYAQTIIKGVLVVIAMGIDAPGVNKYIGIIKIKLQGVMTKRSLVK
jgi:ribose/xylose/arabinose/galactoside ABC-type transport system permease subunit